MYAIQNATNKKFLFGTDYRQPYEDKDGNVRYKQRTSTKKALLYESVDEAEHDILVRRCSDQYKAIEVALIIK